jgi:hypothetical protein
VEKDMGYLVERLGLGWVGRVVIAEHRIRGL